MVLQIEFFFHCKNLPGWSGRIQLTSAVLPLIMNEDVENVEELGSWAFFLWLEFSATNIRELLFLHIWGYFQAEQKFPKCFATSSLDSD